MSLSTVGKSIMRSDVMEKVTGTAVYCDDLKIQGMLFGALLYSPHAFAKIKKIDTSKASSLPGVHAVVTFSDYPFFYGSVIKDRPIFAKDTVRFTGEVVAAVAADTEQIALDACKQIEVEYEVLKPVFDPIQSMEDTSILVHEDLGKYQKTNCGAVPGTNICSIYRLRKGDIDKGFAESDLVVEKTYRTPAVQHGYIEPHISIADYNRQTERLTVWTSTVAPYNARREISEIWSIPMNKIRVIVPTVGGSFGAKMYIKTEIYAVALALKCGKPVKVVMSRGEEFAMAVRGASVTTIKTGVKNDGTILARQVKTVWDTGAYADCGPTVCRLSGHASPGPYRIPNNRVDGYTVYTNKNISCAFRGYGVQETAYAYESHMDDIAAALHMDPIAFRLKNALVKGDEGATGQIVHSGGLVESIKKVSEALDWEHRERIPNHGYGIAAIHKGTGNGSWDAATIMMNEDCSSYNLLMSVIDQGQGSNTVMAQMAAEALGVNINRIHVSSPDTDYTPFDGATTGSRATYCMGNTIRDAANDLKRKACAMGARFFGVPVENIALDLRPERGKIWVKDQPDQCSTLYAVMRKVHEGRGGTVLGEGYFKAKGENNDPETGMNPMVTPFWMYAVQGVEVEVDPSTGKVTILRAVGSSDVGKAINPMNVIQQVQGGMVQGMSGGMNEDVLLDRNGIIVNPNLVDYKMFTTMDMPKQIEAYFTETADEDGPFGAKGLGEGPVAPGAPAIANAVFDAIGIRFTDAPLTSDKILAALEEQK